MRRFLTGTTAALLIGAATLAVATPADAQRWRGGPGWHGGRGWHGGGWNRGWRGGGWNRGWRGYRGYGGSYRGYGRDRTGIAIGAGLLGLGLGAAIASSNRGYYDGYGYGGYAGYYGDCYTRRVWDPYLGRPVRVRYCD